MKEFLRTLKIAGILCLVVSLFNIYSLMMDIFVIEFSVYFIVSDSICLAFSLITGITYLCFLRKSEEKILQQKLVFSILLFLNIFNGLVVWIISFWALIAVNKLQAEKTAVYLNGQSENNFNLSNDETIIVDNKETYEIRQKSQALVTRLEELKKLRDKNLISEEEYNNLRQEAIKTML